MQEEKTIAEITQLQGVPLSELPLKDLKRERRERKKRLNRAIEALMKVDQEMRSRSSELEGHFDVGDSVTYIDRGEVVSGVIAQKDPYGAKISTGKRDYYIMYLYLRKEAKNANL